ncbi:Uncharacterised protein [uncultured archaeon]|nr:Uncharacterised protein [uncultured archaeon]
MFGSRSRFQAASHIIGSGDTSMAQFTVTIIFQTQIGKRSQHFQSTFITALKMQSRRAISMMILLWPPAVYGFYQISSFFDRQMRSYSQALMPLVTPPGRPGPSSPLRQPGPRARMGGHLRARKQATEGRSAGVCGARGLGRRRTRGASPLIRRTAPALDSETVKTNQFLESYSCSSCAIH